MSENALAGHLMRLVGILAIVLANGFFVAAEFAFVKLRDTQLDAWIAKGHKRARLARHILQNLTSYLSATQLGITLASLALGWLGQPVFMALLTPVMELCGIHSQEARVSIAFAVGFSVTTFLEIVVGELGPKWFAIQKALPVALFVAAPLHWFYRLSLPFNWALNKSAQWLMRSFGIDPLAATLAEHSEEELRIVLGQPRAGSTHLGRDIVLNALDLKSRTVREVMRPRTEIVALDTQATMAECLELAEKQRFSRLPLCEDGNLDKTLGVVHFKDLFAMRGRGGRGADLVRVARKLIYVPETTRLEKLLQLFLERKVHIAIVIDEYGGTVGIVTLENILEELVGQIQDEFDQEKPLCRRRNDHTWDLDGALPAHELAELVGQDFSEDGAATASGWMTQRLGGFPKVGDAVKIGPFELRVEETDGARVSRLVLTRQPADTQSGLL
ncbi:MAG TPA: hemolysin family protein [Verrucomicrobiae bacterium]|jgi:CBS domain containing-hemolysin-like protein|nr:hemolysin family protein [Verrucomicrobiae bacterium]